MTYFREYIQKRIHDKLGEFQTLVPVVFDDGSNNDFSESKSYKSASDDLLWNGTYQKYECSYNYDFKGYTF